MDDNNYVDIPLSLRQAFVYRIIPVPRLFELFETKQNILVKPKLWEDPFENFILQSAVRLPTGQLATLHARDQVYGQCWTLHSTSDAMWRIYSKDHQAVRIRTSIGKLVESLGRACGHLSYFEAFIGKVKYLPNKRLIQFAKGAFQTPTLPYSRMYAQTLLVKRPAFKHEREVRLLYFCSDPGQISKDIYSYPVDPHALVDQIMIDPRLKEDAANFLRDQIRAKTRFTGPIKRSLLYAMPPDLTIPFD